MEISICLSGIYVRNEWQLTFSMLPNIQGFQQTQQMPEARFILKVQILIFTENLNQLQMFLHNISEPWMDMTHVLLVNNSYLSLQFCKLPEQFCDPSTLVALCKSMGYLVTVN